MMWSTRDYVTEAYETTPNTMQVRLSGVDLAVTRSEIEPSPFLIPAAPDTRRSPLPAVSRPEPVLDELPPEIEMKDGKTRLFGTVLGPDGPIGGAIVGIERHTTEGIGSLNVSTNAEGRWTAGGLPGGRFRVRAWLPGLMTTGGSEVRYVPDEEKAEFAFSMWGIDPTPRMEFVDGGPIYAGLPGSVAVVLSQQAIDENGIVVTTPVVGGLITIEVTPEVTVASSPIQLTGLDGAARFTLNCTGSQSGGTLIARSGELSAAFPLPGCRPLPTPQPAPAPEPAESNESANG